MKPKTVILMVVAITCGLGASYMTSRLLAQRGEETEDNKVDIIVAAEVVDMGMPFKNLDKQFTTKTFLRGQEPKDAVTDREQLKGKILKRPLRPGDFINQSDLFSDKEFGLSFLMKQGYRGHGIRVTMESGAAGFATLPLNYVDIISVVRRGDDKSTFAHILLQHVLVLAIDTQDKRDTEGRSMPGSVATVMLKPEDVLKVALASELGTLRLVLRELNDSTIVDVDRFTADNLVTGTKGKDADTDYRVGETGSPAVAKVNMPPLPKDAKTAVVIEEPKYTVKVMTIREGESVKKFEFYYDRTTGEPVEHEVSRSDVAAPSAPPRPPVPAATEKKE